MAEAAAIAGSGGVQGAESGIDSEWVASSAGAECPLQELQKFVSRQFGLSQH